MIDRRQYTKKDNETWLRDNGYFLLREYNPWGRMDCYAKYNNMDKRLPAIAELLFYDNGILRTPKEMYEELQENWIPSSQDEACWKLDCMKTWFGSWLER